VPKPKGGAAVLREMYGIAKEYGPESMRTLGKAAAEGDIDAAKALQRFFNDFMKAMGEGEASEVLKEIARIRAGKRPPGRPSVARS